MPLPTNPSVTLEAVVLDRVQREVRRAGQEPGSLGSVVSAIHATLQAPGLSDVERTLCAETLEARESSAAPLHADHAHDLPTTMAEQRIQAAISAGLQVAQGQSMIDTLPLAPTVLVLRQDKDWSQKQACDQVAPVLKKILATLDLGAGDGSGSGDTQGRSPSPTLLVVAGPGAYEDLQSQLASRKEQDVLFRRGLSESGDSDPHAVEVVCVETAQLVSEEQIREILNAELESPRAVPDKAKPHDPLIGTLLHGKYRIRRSLGTGGFGAVYEARDERGAGNLVAIKVLHAKVAADQKRLRAFRDEARRVTRLQHRNIVDWKVFDEAEDGTHYFVMELLKGEELDDLLKREGRLEPNRAARMLLGVLDALRAAHQLAGGHSILHLDLKPQNVFVLPPQPGKEEQVKVFDFGIGQYTGGKEGHLADDREDPATSSPAEQEIDTSESTLTFSSDRESTEVLKDKQGTPFLRVTSCTPEYASPEQCAHIKGQHMEPLDGRSDVYSLGVMAYHMLTGKFPFDAPRQRIDLIKTHMEGTSKTVAESGIKVPKDLASFVDRCLIRDRDLRWGSAEEAYLALDRIVHPPVWRRVAAVLAPVAVVVGALFIWILATKEPGIPEVPLVLGGTALNEINNPVYMGPELLKVELKLRQDHLDSAPLAGTPVTLRRSDNGAVLEGWTVAWEEQGQLSLKQTSPEFKGMSNDRVVLKFESEGLRIEPFRLIWLGEEAWSIDSIDVKGQAIGELNERSVDPAEVTLDLWIKGDGRDELSAVEYSFAGAKWTTSEKGPDQEGRARYSIPLPKEGETAEVHLRATDLAGGIKKRTESVPLTHGKVGILNESLMNIDGSEEAKECSKRSDSYVLNRLTKPALKLEFDRPVDLTWWITVDGQEYSKKVVKPGKKTFQSEVIDLSEIFSGEDHASGTFKYEATDAKYVIHGGEPESRKWESSLKFNYYFKVATFTAKLREGESIPLIAEDSRTFYTNREEPMLTVIREALVPMNIRVTWSKVVTPPASADSSEQAQPFKLNSDQNEKAIPLQFPSDGKYRVRVQSFPAGTDGGSKGDNHDQEVDFDLVRDTSPPEISMPEVEDGQVFKDPDAGAVELHAQVDSEIPVNLTWTWSHTETEWEETGSLKWSDDPLPFTPSPQPWTRGGNPDGKYLLTLKAKDLAGNDAKPAKWELEVAVKGPVLKLHAPTEGQTWKAKKGVWELRVDADDPNGIEDLRYTIKRKGGADKLPPLPETYLELKLDKNEEEYVGSLKVPYTWSKSEVYIDLVARDKQFKKTEEREGPFTLDTIESDEPSRIQPRQGSAMRLVKGIGPDSTYRFGGQGDDIENDKFKEAGLGYEFNKPRDKPRSWNTVCSPGHIPTFYLDEHEVSCEDFLKFVNSDDWSSGEDRQNNLKDSLEAVSSKLFPVTGITWAEAQAYATWIGKRLPSFFEFEYAVRGGTNYRPFAGHDPAKTIDPENVWADHIQPVGTSPDRTPDTEIYDLAGNVSEWTATPFTRDETGGGGPMPDQKPPESEAKKYWTFGASYKETFHDFSIVDRRGSKYDGRRLGFRCALALEKYRNDPSKYDTK